MEELTYTTKFSGISHLNFSYSPRISEAALIELIKSPNALAIKHLNLSGLDVSDNFTEILCISPFMRNLVELLLNDSVKVSFKVFEVFTKTDAVTSIERIELCNSLRLSPLTATKKSGGGFFLMELLEKRKRNNDFKQFTKTAKLQKLSLLNLQGC